MAWPEYFRVKNRSISGRSDKINIHAPVRAKGGFMIKGSGNSAGIAIGRAFVLCEKSIKVGKEQISDVQAEVQRLDAAVKEARTQIEALFQEAVAQLGLQKAQIFETHIELLEDPGYLGKVKEKILTQKVNAEWALKEVTDYLVTAFEEVDGDIIKERIADLRDIAGRVTRALLNVSDASDTGFAEFDGGAVIIADNLLPSQTIQIDFSRVAAMATQSGGVTSHTAIIAKAHGLPAVMGAKGLLSRVKTGDLVIVDAEAGRIYVNPGGGTLAEYQEKIGKQRRFASMLFQYIDIKAATADGKRILVEANIAGPADILPALKNGSDGVGLFRSEFLYMERDSLPAEEEQFCAYRQAVQQMGGLPLVIRTMDIGGDKPLPYMDLPRENNPFLGFRAIRICLERRDLFQTQLRAILRASAYGKLAVMFPMISSMEELRQAKSILEEVKKELDAEHMAYDPNISTGIMVETPAAALISDMLAGEADFFSIGTNDLIQYTTAVDRMNDHIAHLYSAYHPAVLRQIKLIAENAHRAGITAAVCGEAAGYLPLIPVLLGLGVDVLSMSAPLIPRAKWVICSSSMEDAKQLAEKVLTLSTAAEIKERLDENYANMDLSKH